MKRLFQVYPNISRLIIAIFLLALALILSGIIPVPIPHFGEYFPFLGTGLVVLVTWFMFRTENKNLTALGFDGKRSNLRFLPLGLLLGILAFVAGFYVRTLITGEQWNINRDIKYADLFRQLYWILPTAAVQEFLIRGYCFKKLIDMTNQRWAIFLTGLAFIAMHDFWNGNVVQIMAYALTLFIGHLMFAEALLKSGTIYFAIGLHWGNNFANSTLFTQGPAPTSLAFTTMQPAHEISLGQFALLFSAMNSAFLILTYIIWRWPRRGPTGLLVKT